MSIFSMFNHQTFIHPPRLICSKAITLMEPLLVSQILLTSLNYPIPFLFTTLLHMPRLPLYNNVYIKTL